MAVKASYFGELGGGGGGSGGEGSSGVRLYNSRAISWVGVIGSSEFLVCSEGGVEGLGGWCWCR